MAAILLTATTAACDGGGDGDEPSPASSGLPEPQDGRLTRLLGDGTGEPLTGTQPVPGAPVALPVFLTVEPGGDLLGSQWRRSLFTLDPGGTAEALGDEGDRPWHAPVTALAGDETVLVLVDETDTVTLGTVSLDDGGFTEVATLTDGVENVPVSGLLELPDATYIQWAGTWWTITGGAADPTGAEPSTPPVEGIIASARTDSGVAVLTDTELVRLDESLQETGRSAWSLPPELDGQALTAVVGDGADGLYATTATAASDGGGVVHITPDGVDLLAAGARPDGDDTDCDDADTEATAAHLALPIAVAVWQERLVVADQVCSSLLQLPLP